MVCLTFVVWVIVVVVIVVVVVGVVVVVVVVIVVTTIIAISGRNQALANERLPSLVAPSL